MPFTLEDGAVVAQAGERTRTVEGSNSEGGFSFSFQAEEPAKCDCGPAVN